MLTPDHERWAEAAAILDRYGDGWAIFIVERWMAAAKSGDEAEIARWRDLHQRCDQLDKGPIQ